MVRPTDQETTAIGKITIILKSQETHHTLEGCAEKHQVWLPGRNNRGKHRQGHFLGFQWESVGKAEKPGLGLAGLNNFSGLGHKGCF